MNFKPRILAILCNWCSYAGADLAGVSRFQYPPTTRVIRVMCSTRVEPSFVIKAFLKGVDGVLVGGCHLGDCHYVTGNYYTVGKMKIAKKLLQYAGVNAERLRLEWISASEGEKFANVVTDFTKKLTELGPFKDELKNELALKAAYYASLKPRIRILAAKERMLTTQGNKYGEIYTEYEFDRIADEIVYDEINEEMIRILLQQKELTLEEISEKTGIDKNLVFLYIVDLIKRGEVEFKEKEGIFLFSHCKGEKSYEIYEPVLNGSCDGGEGVVIVGAGAHGIKKAIEFANKGEDVFVIERHPSITPYTIRKHESSLNEEAPINEFQEMVKEGKIKLLTNAWIKSFNDGKLKIIKYPTKIASSCDNCNVCYEVCPLKTVDRERSLFSRKAVYGRNGIPSTFFIERESPFCQTSCPAHVDVRGYVARIAEGKFQEALDLIRERLPLPGVLGRVCPHPCEEMCRRNGIDEAVSIRLLKRFVADWEWERKGKIDLGKMPVNENNRYKIAIIGSGPAGLTAAYELAKKGYKVTIFEALPVAGGMLAVGIPSYRLPKDVLKREVDAILNMGVEIKLDTKVGKDVTFEELKEKYDAIFIGIGAHLNRKLEIEGEELEGVIPGVDFLREVNIAPEAVRAVFEGRKIAIIGGGDVAIDAARCARRLGADEVTIIYRRSRKEMPAREEEVKFAEEEGINFKFLVAPKRIIGKDGKVCAIECIEMELGEPDESGRRRPIPKEGSEFIMEVDTVVVAIGQYPDLSFLPEEIKKTKWGIVADDTTAATSMEGVFAGGDAVTGPSIVIEAVAWGRKAAFAIDAYLHGKEIKFDPIERNINRAIVSWEDIELMKRNTSLSLLGKEERRKVEMIPPTERMFSFKEVEKGFDSKTAVEEARRCRSCRECLGCGICGNECPKDAIDYGEEEKEIEIKTKDILVDTEIYFGIDSNAFTPFEVEDMLNLGILMNFDGKKVESAAFLNDKNNKYIKELKERLVENGVKIVEGNNADMLINCDMKEIEYYKKLKRILK